MHLKFQNITHQNKKNIIRLDQYMKIYYLGSYICLFSYFLFYVIIE